MEFAVEIEDLEYKARQCEERAAEVRLDDPQSAQMLELSSVVWQAAAAICDRLEYIALGLETIVDRQSKSG